MTTAGAIVRLFASLEAGADRVLEGVGMRYGVTETVHGQPTRFLAGMFGDVAALDVVLTAHHIRERPLARTGGGGLTLSETAERLNVRAELADTQEGRDIYRLVKGGVLRGLSLEIFRPVEIAMVAGVREFRRAALHRLSVVDTPAMPGATVAALSEGARWRFPML